MTAPMMIPPFAQPVADVLEALAVLERRLTAADASVATAAAAIKPLTSALEDALADDVTAGADDAPLMEAERVHRRAKAEAAGLRRRITQQRTKAETLAAEGQAKLQAAYADAMKRINGRYVAERKKLMATLAEAVGLADAAGDGALSWAISQMRLPPVLQYAPDTSAWRGVSTMTDDIPPVTSDAAQQLAMTAFVFQKARMAANEDLQATG